MYFPESFYDYKAQSRFYSPNLLAQQGNTFLAEQPFSSRSPCLYSSHRQHSFTQHTAPQTAGTQNLYQAYNLPPMTTNQEQRRLPISCGDSSFGSQELAPQVESSLPAYFRVKSNLMGQNGRRCRKSRTVFTDLQLRMLEKTFSDHKYLDTTHRAKVAHTLHLNETQVKTWFQNRRMKWKRESPESTMAIERAKGKDCTNMKANDRCPIYFAGCK